MKKHLFFTTLILLSGASMYASTLPSVQRDAAQSRPLLKAQSQTVAQSEHLTSHARGAYLPQLSAQYSTRFTQEHSTLDKSIHSITLSGSQLIYKANGPQLQAQISEQGVVRAKHTFRASSNQVQHDVVHAFLDAWLLQEKHLLITSLQELSELTADKAAVAHDALQMNVHEHALTNATSAQQAAEVASYKHEKESALVTLHTLTGHSSTRPQHLEYLPQQLDTIPPLSECLQTAYASRPELKEKKCALEQQQLTARSHRLSYLPSINLTGSYGRVFAGTGPQRGTDASIGITATWSFFDGLQRSHAAHAADAGALRIEFEMQELKNSITREVTAAYHAVQAAQLKYDAAQKMEHAHTGLWQEAQDRFEFGGLDRVSHAKQQHAYQQAAHALRTAHIAYRKQLETLNLRCGYALTIISQGASS